MICLSKEVMKNFRWVLNRKTREPMARIRLERKTCLLLDERGTTRHSAEHRGGMPEPHKSYNRATKRVEVLWQMILSNRGCRDWLSPNNSVWIELLKWTLGWSSSDMGVIQDVQGQGQGIEQSRHDLFDIVTEKVETLDTRFHKYDEIVQTVLAKTDKQGHEVCTAVGRIITEQEDTPRIVEELARRIDSIRDGTRPEGPPEVATQSEVGVATQLELSDLKTNVQRLTEQVTCCK